MIIFNRAILFSIIFYGLFHDIRLLYYFLGFIAAYLIIYSVFPGEKLPTRRKMAFRLWEKDYTGTIYVKEEVDCENVIKYQ